MTSTTRIQGCRAALGRDGQPARLGLLFVLAVLVGTFATSALRAQESPAVQAPLPQSVQVGLYVSPPFVMRDGSNFTGMALELWEALASNLGPQPEYQEYDTFRDLVTAAATGEIDVAVTNLTITQNRALRLDFTQPWFDAGLRIMISEDRRASFWDVMGGLRDSGHLRAYAWLAFVILAATGLLTLFDRHFDKDFPRRWRDGVAESFYTVMTVATSGRTPSRKNLFGWLGRIWQGMWLVCGIAVLAYVTSSVTSVMTTLSLTNQVNSLADLPGKPVGVFTGSVAEEFAEESALRYHSFAGVDEAVDALIEGRIAAIVGDAPVLEYYVHTHPEAHITVVGAIFEPDKYGFGLTRGSSLTKTLTVELLGAHESGLVEELRVKYFGDAL